MGRNGHSPELLVSESPVSAARPSGEESSHSRANHRRKVFYLLDSLNALAEAILQLLRDPVLAGQLGANGCASVSSEFSFERLIEKTDQMYTDLLRSRGVE